MVEAHRETRLIKSGSRSSSSLAKSPPHVIGSGCESSLTTSSRSPSPSWLSLSMYQHWCALLSQAWLSSPKNPMDADVRSPAAREISCEDLLAGQKWRNMHPCKIQGYLIFNQTQIGMGNKNCTMVFTSKTLDAYGSKYGFLGFDQFPNPLFEAHEVQLAGMQLASDQQTSDYPLVN